MNLLVALLLACVPSSKASKIVTFELSSASSSALVELLYQATATDAKCKVSVERPIDEEPAMETDHQELVCSWKGGAESRVQPFTNSKIDSWGQRRDPRSFEVLGDSAESLFEKFEKKTHGMANPEPKDSLWSRIYLCDEFGVTCLQTIFLNAEPSPDSPGQIACSRNSSLTMKSEVAIDPSSFVSYPDYLNAIVITQIRAGHRKVDKTSCVFMAP